MNVETGEIKEFKTRNSLAEALATGNWKELAKRPNPGCKKCHGRGHRGRNIKTNKFVLCSCVKKRPVKNAKVMPKRNMVRQENAEVTIGYDKSMTNSP